VKKGNQTSRAIPAMLENLNGQVRECLRRAEESAERAKREQNPTLKRDFLEMEERWLKLARSYQFLERLGSFTNYNNAKRTELSRRLEQLSRVIDKGERKP
jgi:hypothetical protein